MILAIRSAVLFKNLQSGSQLTWYPKVGMKSEGLQEQPLDCHLENLGFQKYSKTCLKKQRKNTQNKGLNGKWQVESIAECSPWSILQYF